MRDGRLAGLLGTVAVLAVCALLLILSRGEAQSATEPTLIAPTPPRCPAGMHLDGHHGHIYLCGPDRPVDGSR